MNSIRMITLLWGIALIMGCSGANAQRHAPLVKTANNNTTDTVEIIRNVVRKKAIPNLLNNGYLNRPSLIISGRIAETTTIDGKIDGLSKMIRHAVILELLKYPGIALVQRHRLQHYGTPGHVQRLNCRNYNSPEYYLLIDTRAGNNKVYVDMVVLNTEDDSIQSGTGVNFDFVKTAAMAELLEKKMWDEYLVGTKHLPIAEDDRDAVAAYLGYSMVCILQNIYMPKNSGVLIERSGLDNYDVGIINFLENYLISYGVPVTNDEERATRKLESEVGVSNGIYIFWVRLKDTETNMIVPYSSTRVYYKKPEEALTFSIRRLAGNKCIIEVQSDIGQTVENFRLMENGRRIFPNRLCIHANNNYRINGDTAILDFSQRNSIILGGDDSTFNLILAGSGRISAYYSINGENRQISQQY